MFSYTEQMKRVTGSGYDGHADQASQGNIMVLTPGRSVLGDGFGSFASTVVRAVALPRLAFPRYNRFWWQR